MNRRGFIAALSSLPVLFFGRKARATAPTVDVLPKEHNFIVDVPAGTKKCCNPGCEAFVYDKGGVSLCIGADDECPANDASEKMYTDIEEMFTDIGAHVKRTGDLILNADNPMFEMVGFTAEEKDGSFGQKWSITVTHMARSINAMEKFPDQPLKGGGGVVSPRLKAQVYREYMKTQSGRRKLAQSFRGQRAQAT